MMIVVAGRTVRLQPLRSPRINTRLTSCYIYLFHGISPTCSHFPSMCSSYMHCTIASSEFLLRCLCYQIRTCLF
uniref:Uncharacterized protein n=1 Tax=Aegilops tauschii subsp. strangulata TaxID=200361 RepID=A0A452XTL1_AEGTS